MHIHQFKYAYFLGIGGIGMSAIARYFKSVGIRVSGYDRTRTPLTIELEQEGMQVHYADIGSEVESLLGNPEDTLVVLTPAIPKNHTEWLHIQKLGYPVLKRAEVLGLLSRSHKTLGIAGTHGKTTTSTMLAHILHQSEVDGSAFLGGISANYHTNLLMSSQSPFLTVEADEFDRSFLTLTPFISVITSTDADHLDIYGEHEALKQSFAAYAHLTTHALIIKKELELTEHLLNQPHAFATYTYSIEHADADYAGIHIRIEQGYYLFDLKTPEGIIPDLKLGMPGRHNVENAVAACAVALRCGVSAHEIRTGLLSFKGVKRRFEYHIHTPTLTYIDDYAHHPTEIHAIISSVKEMYPGIPLHVLFQPHLYSRTRDFAAGFAKSLSQADSLLLLDIYPARELPIPGVSSDMIYNQLTLEDKRLGSLNEASAWIKEKKPTLLLSIGAGDIDTLIPEITQLLRAIHEVE